MSRSFRTSRGVRVNKGAGGGGRAARALGCSAAVVCCSASLVFGLGAAPAAADAQRSAEWAISALDLPAAQQISTGAGVTVAVLDTGVVAQRADLAGQVTTGPDYAGGSERPGGAGWGEHGTCMASIIAGHGHGPGDADGTLGVAPGAHILSVRVIRDDDAPDASAALTDPNALEDGIRYAVDHGAKVISMSLSITSQAAGADSDATPIANAVRYALSHDVAVVAAAGNGEDGGAALDPGAARGVITVGAVDSAGRPAAFASAGWDVDVSAPGVGVPCDDAQADDEYIMGDGTSQATAFVAGLVALIRAKNPALSPAQVLDVLEHTATNRPAGGRDDTVGFGTVDPVAALHAAAGLKGAPEAPAPGPGPSGGYFGFGPVQPVTEQTGLSAHSRAVYGGAVLLVLGLMLLARGLRRRVSDDLVPLSIPAPGALTESALPEADALSEATDLSQAPELPEAFWSTEPPQPPQST